MASIWSKPCRYFNDNFCHYGASCRFYHSESSTVKFNKDSHNTHSKQLDDLKYSISGKIEQCVGVIRSNFTSHKFTAETNVHNSNEITLSNGQNDNNET